MLTPRARYRWQCPCRASYRNKKSGSILGGVLHIFGLPSLRAVCVDFHTAREEGCGEGEALQSAVFGEGDPDELLCVAYRGKKGPVSRQAGKGVTVGNDGSGFSPCESRCHQLGWSLGDPQLLGHLLHAMAPGISNAGIRPC